MKHDLPADPILFASRFGHDYLIHNPSKCPRRSQWNHHKIRSSFPVSVSLRSAERVDATSPYSSAALLVWDVSWSATDGAAPDKTLLEAALTMEFGFGVTSWVEFHVLGCETAEGVTHCRLGLKIHYGSEKKVPKVLRRAVPADATDRVRDAVLLHNDWTKPSPKRG